MSKEYSPAIAAALRDFLDRDNWQYEFDAAWGAIRFNLTLKGKIKQIRYIINITTTEYSVYGFPNIGGDPEEKQTMQELAEFVCRVNYGLKNGCFELDMQDGELRYRTYVDCEGQLPGEAPIRNSIYLVTSMIHRYAPGFQALLFAGVPAAKAIELCNESS